MTEKNTKIIKFTAAANARIHHSKELEFAVRNFITLMDGHYYYDELEAGVLKSYFRLKNDLCVEQRLQIRNCDYICLNTISYCVSPKDEKEILRCIRIANSINCELDYGCFQVNTDNGEIIFRTYYEPDDKVYMEALDKLLGYPNYIIIKYGNRFKNEVPV